MYLYTLELPNFANKQVFPNHLAAAVNAYFLGDKYNLPRLRDHGRSSNIHHIQTSVNTWHKDETLTKGGLILFIGAIWKWTITDSDQVREAVLGALMSTSKAMIEDKRFQKLMKENKKFHMASLRAFVRKATRK